MKMVKSLLLVSAAGLVAASGAQAADLPVKAKPVEYVKVCSLYGAGFYYIPGTDICMKIGGYVRFQQNFGSTGITAGPFSGAGAANNRVATADYSYRSRYLLTHDTRQQTAYGTLRTYMILGFSSDSSQSSTATNLANNTPGIYSTRAFIQIAGFTFGKATSYFDFISSAAVAYNAGNTFSSDTGDGGHIVAAYTAQLGNGLSATISAEQARKRAVLFLGPAVGGTAGSGVIANLSGAAATAAVTDNRLQDIVANIRVDQAWGSAQLAFAAHDTSASYYGAGPGGVAINEQNGHPGSEWGWAISGGLRLNAPMIGPGDYFQIGVNYAEGATQYASNTPSTAHVFNGQSYGNIFHNDGGFTGTAATPGIFELATAFSMFASYEHFWTPSLRTSLYGSYFEITRSDALNNAMCTAGGTGVGGSAATTTVTTATIATSRAGGCDLDASTWVVGSRSQWNITKDLYVGVDVMYSKLNTAQFNNAGLVTFTAVPAGKVGGTQVYRVEDQDAFSATWRIHRDIVP